MYAKENEIYHTSKNSFICLPFCLYLTREFSYSYLLPNLVIRLFEMKNHTQHIQFFIETVEAVSGRSPSSSHTSHFLVLRLISRHFRSLYKIKIENRKISKKKKKCFCPRNMFYFIHAPSFVIEKENHVKGFIECCESFHSLEISIIYVQN